MGFPRSPLRMRMLAGDVSGAWRDITGDVLDRDGVLIRQGSTSPVPQQFADSSQATFTLQNDRGKWTARNPRSPLFGVVARRPPLRVHVAPETATVPSWVDDLTGRTVASGSWGTAVDSSGRLVTYALSGVNGGAADFSVTAGTGGAVLMAVAGSFRLAVAQVGSQAPRARNADVSAVVSAPVATGGDFEVEVLLRCDPATANYQRLRLVFGAGGVLTAHLMTMVTGNESTLQSAAVGISHTSASQAWGLRLQAVGDSLYGRVWEASVAEPSTWTVQSLGTVGTSVGAVVGSAGMRFGRSAANTNSSLTVRVGRLAVESTVCRFAGEISEWGTSVNLAGVDVVAGVTASGVSRRLRRRDRPVLSPLARSIPTAPELLAYWPMEDGAQTMDVGASWGSPVASGPALVIEAGTTKGRASNWAGSGDLPVMGTSRAIASFPAGGNLGASRQDTFSLAAVVSVPTSGVAATVALMSVTSLRPAGDWTVQLNPAGQLQLQFFQRNGLTVTNTYNSGFVLGPLNGQRARIQLDVKRNGSVSNQAAPVLITVVEGVQSSAVAATLPLFLVNGSINGFPVNVRVADGGCGDVAMGHVTVHAPLVGVLASTARQFAGWATEKADDRLTRLAVENALRVRSLTGGVPAAALGVQPLATLGDILQDLARPAGWLADDVQDLGLVLRTWGSSALPGGEFAASLSEVSPPVDLVDGDNDLTNDVTVTRSGGAQVRVTQTIGPLAAVDPPTGVGAYPTAESLSLATDSQVTQQAWMRLAAGTVDEQHVTNLRIDFGANPSLLSWLGDTDAGFGLGSGLLVTDLPVDFPPSDLDLLVTGWVETIDSFTWRLDTAVRPRAPWRAFVVDGGAAAASRADTAASSLASAVTATATVFSVDSTGPRWMTGSSLPAFPFDATVGGVERVRVTGISGASNPQTFTVVRGTAGYSQSHPAGADVRLWRAGRAVL